MRTLLWTACLLLFSSGAWAVCPNPLTVKDAAGATQNISTTNDGSGNCQSAIVINIGGLVAGSAVDGWDLTQGAKADAAWVSGSGSVVSILKNIAGGVAGPVPSPNTPAGWGIGATASAPPANAVYQGVSASGALTGQVSCDNHTFKHITSATDTLLVQGVSAKIIKICGVKTNFTGSAAQSVFIENTASINANCSSSNTQIGPLITGSSTVPFSDGFYNPMWGGFANTSANGLCVNSSGTGVVDVEVWYTQGS